MPPEKKKYKVSRQALADFSATIEAKPNLSEEELFQKFPEFNSDRDLLQSALDYHTTKKSGKYKTDQELDAKFPEFEFEAPTPQDTENIVRQFAQEQQRNKKGYAIDKKFEPEIKSWIDNEVSTARSLAQAEFNTWSKAREQQLKSKGLQGDALEMALSKEQGSKLDEINKRLDTDLSTKYKSKLEEFENLTLNAPPKASATATMAPKKDAGILASFGKQIANVFANTLPGSVAAMTSAELPSTLDEWKVGGRRSPNFNKSINHLIEDLSRFGEKDNPVDRAMLNSLKRTKDFLGKDNYNDSLYDPQSKEAMFADFFKEEIQKEKQNLLAEAKKQKEEAGELLKDVPTSWDDAKKAGNISGYVSGAIGQGLGTTGLALATVGTGAFVLEAGEIYQEANAEKAKYLSNKWGVNVTPEDVVLYGEDNDSKNAAVIGGVINSGLEFLGGKLGLSKFAKAMVGKKIVGNLVRNGAMGAGGEGATELVQEMVNIIAARTAGQNPDKLRSEDWDRLIEAARQGAIAGGTFSSVGSTVSQVNEKVQQIGNLIDQVGLPGMEYAQVQNQIFSDAVQKQAAGQVPLQPEATGGQEIPQAQPQPEPQTITQTGQINEEVKQEPLLEGVQDGGQQIQAGQTGAKLRPQEEITTQEEATGGTTEDKLQPFSRVKERQVRDLEKADEATFTQQARQTIDRAFQSGLIDDQQVRNLSALLNNASGKNATPRSRKQFFDAMRTDLKLPVDQRTNQIKERIADIKSKILGMRMEKKITKARLAEVKSVTDPMFKDLDIPSHKAKRAVKRILRTNFGSDLQVERLASYLTDLARGIEADMLFEQAEQAKASLVKNKDKVLQNLRPHVDKIIKLDINNVDDLGEYTDNVNNILQGLKPGTPTNEQQAAEYADKAFAQEAKAKRERLTDLGVPTEGVADEDLDGLLSFAEEKEIIPAKGDQHRQHLEQQFVYSALAVEELADELAQKGDTKLQKIITIDPASFNTDKELVMAIRVLDYIAQNGYDPKVGVANLGVLEAKVELDEAIPNMPKLEGIDLPNLTVNLMKTEQVKGLMSALRRLFGTRESANKLATMAGFNERMLSAAKSASVVAKVTKAMEDVFDAAKKAGYKLNTVPAVRRTNMIGMLLSYPEGGNKYMYFDKMKSNLAQSLETMKDDPKSAEFYENDKKALDEFLSIPNRDEFEAHVNKKYPWEMKLLSVGKNALAERFEDFAKRSLEYFNEHVGKQEGYFGSFRFKSRNPLPSDPKLKSSTRPRSANSAIQRQYTLPTDKYYNLNFTDNVLRTLKEQYDVIETAHGQTKSDMFLQDKRAVDILGGPENYRKVNTIYQSMNDAFLGRGIYKDENYGVVGKAITIAGDLVRAYVFSGLPAYLKGMKYLHTRYWKQFMPTIVNSTVQMAGKKPEAVKFLFTHIPPNLKLLEDKPIKMRSRVMGGLAVDNMEFGSSLVNFEAQFLDRWTAQLKKILARSAAGQIEGDVDSVTRNWIAYYLEYLDSKGIKDVKLEEEHLYTDDVRKEAVAYAQNMVDSIHGESQTETAATWYRNPNEMLRLVKLVAFPFASFMMKQKDRLADNIAIMRPGSGASATAKSEAFRDSMAIAAENVSFAGMAVVFRALFEVASYAAAEEMGLVPPEEDEEKWWNRTWTGFVFNAMVDLIPSWAVLNNDIRNYIATQVNDVMFSKAKQEDPTLTRKQFKDAGNEIYVDPNGSNYGGFTILAGPLDAFYESGKVDFSEQTYTVTDENLDTHYTYLTDEQTNLIYTNAIIALTAPVLGSDLKTISQKITQGQLKQIREDIKRAKDAAN